MADSINTINVGGIDKEVEDTVARTSGANANSRCTALESGLANTNARVDELSTLPEGSTTGDAELMDIRVGYDNVIATSAGNSVRRQANHLIDDLEYITGNREYIFIIGAYIKLSGETADISNPVAHTNYKYLVTPCVEGDAFTIAGSGGSNARIYGFIDDSGNILSVAPESKTYVDKVITAPSNSAYLIVNTKIAASAGDILSYCFKGTLAKIDINTLKFILDNNHLFYGCRKPLIFDEASRTLMVPHGIINYIGEELYTMLGSGGITLSLDINPYRYIYVYIYNDNELVASTNSSDYHDTDGYKLLCVIIFGSKYVFQIEAIVVNGLDYEIRHLDGSVTTNKVTQSAAKDLEQVSNDKIICIAHRGTRTTRPDSTSIAYIHAKEVGFDYAEGDIQRTLDGYYVIGHGDNISDRTGLDVNISESTLDYLKTLDFGSYLDPNYPNMGILTLEEFLNLCDNLDMSPVLDCKSKTPEQVAEILGIVDKWGGEVYNFNGSAATIKSILALRPDQFVRRSYDSYSQTVESEISSILTDYPNADLMIAFYASNSSWTDSVLKSLLNRGLKLCPYEVNSESQYNAYVKGKYYIRNIMCGSDFMPTKYAITTDLNVYKTTT